MSSEQKASEPDESVSASTTGLERRRRWVLGMALGAVVLSVLGIGAAQLIKSPAQAVADSAAPPPSVLSAPVERRVLTDSLVVRGSVTASQTVQVTPAAKGEDVIAPVVTKLPLAAGDSVKAGQLLMEVSGRPVIALKGKLPVYRDLKPGAKGDDVAQLHRALAAVGHSTGSDTAGYFGAGTKSALTALYSTIGYDPLPAQEDSESQIDSAREEVTAAERALEDVTAEKDAAGTSRDKERAEEDLRKAREHLTGLTEKSGPMLAASEIVFLDRFPARVDSVSTRIGATVSGVAMTVSAGDLVVNGYLKAEQKNLVRSGRQVEIYSELTGTSASATVSSVAESVAQQQASDSDESEGTGSAAAGGAGSPGSGYLMVVTPRKALDSALTGQDVRLTVEAATTGGKVLAVPVSAITAGVDGKTFVSVLGAGDARTRVPVATGTTGDGYVEIRPAGAERLAPGMWVVVGVRTEQQGSTGGGQ
ncbi:hypothetical protein ACFPH6_38970 [Streptomyces xiangluensis]|uniref:Peptidoglycan binding domain-containing protein n=1 Tax=Streptomyces xiangluensis TaxID=2665720 RepID=A0ABV8Z2K5_9ACTN